MSVFDLDQFAKSYGGVLLDRAAKSAAHGALLSVGVETTELNALAVDWQLMGGMALGAAVLSLLTNISHRGISGMRRDKKSQSS